MLNSRMPSGMYGGVRGEKKISPTRLLGAIRAFFMPIFKEVRVVANRIKGITVEIGGDTGGDTTGLDKALKSVNSSITKTQSALNDVNRLLKLDPSNTVLVAQKQELLAQAISQTSGRLRKPVES